MNGLSGTDSVLNDRAWIAMAYAAIESPMPWTFVDFDVVISALSRQAGLGADDAMTIAETPGRRLPIPHRAGPDARRLHAILRAIVAERLAALGDGLALACDGFRMDQTWYLRLFEQKPQTHRFRLSAHESPPIRRAGHARLLDAARSVHRAGPDAFHLITAFAQGLGLTPPVVRHAQDGDFEPTPVRDRRGWLRIQAGHLRAGRFEALDLDALAIELERRLDRDVE